MQSKRLLSIIKWNLALCLSLTALHADSARAQGVDSKPAPSETKSDSARGDEKADQNSQCIESLATGGCMLLWQIDATSATGSSGQTNTNTAPNILVRLNYQWKSPKIAVPERGGAPEPDIAWRAFSKVQFDTGYTQVVASTKVQPAGGSTNATSSVCPEGQSSCTAAVPQQAFVAELGINYGFSIFSRQRNVMAQFAIGGRGSFQYLVPSNKVVQNGSATYIDLSSANSNNAVGFYEATAQFRLAQVNHPQNLKTCAGNGDCPVQNVSDLLRFEAGYQNNRALQGLSTSVGQLDTRNRYVARLYVNPEINKSTHTQLSIGMEYSGGIDGGPHVVQLFFGTNLNLPSLFSNKSSESKTH
jgi:hypothetical protein